MSTPMNHKKKPRRKSNRLLWVAIPSHRANTELVALFRNLANTLGKKLKGRHLSNSLSCPLCGTTMTSGKFLEIIHKKGHDQIDVVQKAIVKKRLPTTFAGSTTYLVELEQLKDYYSKYHRKHACITIGCGQCHKQYDDVCKGKVSPKSVGQWWRKINRSWSCV